MTGASAFRALVSRENPSCPAQNDPSPNFSPQGHRIFTLTSSKPLILNAAFASAAFLISAYGIATKQPGPLVFIMPFLVTMLLAGRAMGIYWRGYMKGERELLAPGHMIGGAAAIGSHLCRD